MINSKLSKETMETAFDEMAILANDRGLVFDIAVFGGSCIILASNIRDASADVDAVYLNNQSVVQDIADHVGKKLNLPDDWLNQGVKRMAYPPGAEGPKLSLFNDYPRDTSKPVGVRIFLPTPEYMLAMKIFANRDVQNVDKIESDLADAVGLMKVTGITTEPAMIEIMSRYYGSVPGLLNPTKPRLKAKIELLVEAYAKSSAESEPTWDSGRGHSSRSP